MNVWRDYTAALQDLLNTPPKNTSREVPSTTEVNADQQKDPFDREQKLADGIAARAVAAARLKDAIAALRTARTRKQLQTLISVDDEG